MNSVLFISYDGLLDPLGGSQILPYLHEIASHPRSVHILSFEKPARFAEGGNRMRSELTQRGIGWTPISFTSRWGKLGKVWDLARMYSNAVIVQRRHKFDIIHCRSYQAMQVGCLLGQVFGVKTLFDMRGLWVDERVDGGIWQPTLAVDRLLYRSYKRIEKRLLGCATHVIALTERVVPELRRLAPMMTSRISVIPCCADFDHFDIPTRADRERVRAGLGIPAEARVISYLGSLGTWYMLDEMLRFVDRAEKRWGDVHLLLITRDWGPEHESLIADMGLSSLRPRIHVRPAARAEVPGLLGCSDVMLSFIKPAYSKMASSPTKLAEAFAVGVPAISNTGIGDVDEMTKRLDAGAVVDLYDPGEVEKVVNRLEEIMAKGGVPLRARARALLGLEVARDSYRRVYQDLEEVS